MAGMARRTALATLVLATVGVAAACSGSTGSSSSSDDLDLPPATSPLATARAAANAPGTAVDRSGTGDVVVLLEPTVTGAQQGDIQTRIQGVAGVKGVRYVSQQQAYEEFQCLYAGQPALLARVTPGSLPASLRVDTGGDLSVDSQVLLAVRGAPGVVDILVPDSSSEASGATSASTAPINLAVPVGKCKPGG